MTLFPKTQEGQCLMLAAVFLSAGAIAYFYFGSLVPSIVFLVGSFYSIGFLQGYQRGYWECGKRTRWQGE